MATVINIDTNYNGEAAGKIFTSIFLSADTLDKNAVNVIPNVVGTKAYLRKTELTDGIVDFACGFTPSGTLDLGEKEVTLKKLMLPLEICKETFRQRWSASQMGFSAWNDEIPADEREALLLEAKGLIASTIEKDIWNGDGSVNGHFNGILTELATDTDSNDVTGVAITAANVIDEMGKVLDATPTAVLQRPDFVFAVSTDVYRKYVRALGAANFAQSTTDFEGYELTVLAGLPANSILTYNRENVVFLTGLESDFNELRIKDMDETDLSGNIRIKAVYIAGASYVDGSMVTWYDAQ